jgi:hypothetical protein
VEDEAAEGGLYDRRSTMSRVDDLEMARVVRQTAPELWDAVVRSEVNLEHAFTAARTGVRDYAEYAARRQQVRNAGERLLTSARNQR